MKNYLSFVGGSALGLMAGCASNPNSTSQTPEVEMSQDVGRLQSHSVQFEPEVGSKDPLDTIIDSCRKNYISLKDCLLNDTSKAAQIALAQARKLDNDPKLQEWIARNFDKLPIAVAGEKRSNVPEISYPAGCLSVLFIQNALQDDRYHETISRCSLTEIADIQTYINITKDDPGKNHHLTQASFGSHGSKKPYLRIYFDEDGKVKNVEKVGN